MCTRFSTQVAPQQLLYRSRRGGDFIGSQRLHGGPANKSHSWARIRSFIMLKGKYPLLAIAGLDPLLISSPIMRHRTIVHEERLQPTRVRGHSDASGYEEIQ